MHRFSLICLIACTAGAFAQYGLPAPNPAPQPGYPGNRVGYPWFPSNGGYWDRSSSSSSSESDESREHRKCQKCKKLKVPKINKDEGIQTAKPKIEYYDKDHCRKAIITCPLDENKWLLVAGTAKGAETYNLSVGQHISAVAKCNKKKKYEAKAIAEDKKSTFTHVICVKQNGTAPVVVKETEYAGLPSFKRKYNTEGTTDWPSESESTTDWPSESESTIGWPSDESRDEDEVEAEDNAAATTIAPSGMPPGIHVFRPGKSGIDS